MDRLARVTPQDFPATAPRKDSAPLAERVREALTADFGHLKARQKEIARKAGGISPRTVERWERGEGVPHLELFLELGKHSPALRKMVLRAWNLDADIDPEYGRALADLHRAAAELIRSAR
jgi:transcriptional regulator with XRE-family HTH domain